MSDSSAEDTVSAADTTTWPQQTPIDGPKTERPAAASCCFADTDSLRDVLCACQSLISPVDHADRPVAAVDYPEREACSFVARASTGGCGGSLNTSASRPISSPIKVGYRSSGLDYPNPVIIHATPGQWRLGCFWRSIRWDDERRADELGRVGADGPNDGCVSRRLTPLWQPE